MSGKRHISSSEKASDLAALFSHFAAKSPLFAVENYGSGHIHETYRVRTREKTDPGYILQRINTHVFPDVLRLMENIVRVTGHLRAKASALTGNNSENEVLTVVPGRDDRPFYLDGEGNFWRCFCFIEHLDLGERPQTPGQAFEAGRVFGHFIDRLADLPGPPLHETIPAFHDIGQYLMKFGEVLQADPLQRAGESAREIAFVREHAEEMKTILVLGREGRIPLRTTHNDTKFNNVLFDERGSGLCLIDLDTVMPGYVHYDFGDAVRSAANRSREDEADLESVGLDMDVFRELSRGFLGVLRGRLTAEETAHLAFSAKLLTYMVGLRFLSDYLAGDLYFKIVRPGHNLQRARVQFRLLEDMEKHFGEMEDIVSGQAGKITF